MSDVSARKTHPVRRQRSIYQVHYALQKREEEMAKPMVMPSEPLDVQAYGLQVAGHMSTEDRKYLGILQCDNGTVLKPILKESQKREVEFYTRLYESDHPDLVELRQFVPKYYGCRKYTYNGHEQDYIVLEDLAQRMLEPCIMDVKIGKRTWDPLASEEKIQNEQKKYALCKQEFGFCIPGYQVHRVSTGRLHKYNKENGKRLHGHMVRAAIKNFLNGSGRAVCRALVLQLVAALWRLQRWASRQQLLKVYASSLLLVYDATRLRACCGDRALSPHSCRHSQPLSRSKSSHSISPTAGSNFSGQISSKGPVYKKVSSVPIIPMTLVQASFSPPDPVSSPWSDALDAIANHSFEHNYEDKLSKIKLEYKAMLDQLSTDSPTPNQWGTVKIIDFAHAFFNEEDDMGVDDNFRDGLDSFVAILEEFLRETDEQVL